MSMAQGWDAVRHAQHFWFLSLCDVAAARGDLDGLQFVHAPFRGRGNESVAHIVRLIAGHDLNHLQQIEKIVKAKG